MVRRIDGWMGGWKMIVTQSVMTDEDIRDRGAWRGLVFGEEKHCSVASPWLNEWMNELINELMQY